MTITWDAPMAAGVARELGHHLEDDLLRGHRFLWEKRELSLFFERSILRWSLRPREGWIRLLPAHPLPEDARRLSARCRGVTAPPDERILRLHFKRLRGRIRRVQIVVELMTNQWNALLVEGEDERIRHLLWTRRLTERTLAVGQRYRPPAPSTRAGITTVLSVDEWEKRVGAVTGGARDAHLLETVAFTSPLNLPSLVGGPSEGVLSPERLREGYRLWIQLRSLDPLQPCLLETPGGGQPYPVILDSSRSTPMPSMLEAFLMVAEGEAETVGSRHQLLTDLDRAVRHARGKVASLRREMESLRDPGEPRRKAHLLLAHLARVEKGAHEVTLPDFEEGEVTVSLDPALTPHQNAEALFREASRLERARDRLPRLLLRSETRVRDLERIRAGILRGDLTPEEVATTLPSTGRGRSRDGETRKRPRLPYRTFRSTGGLEIRVGRGSADNDALTFHHSRPQDVWLHARDAAGAHVILRWANAEPPPARDLTEAAVLAAVYSRNRGAEVVPVDWTRRKFVRKPRRAKAGTVIPDRVETLFVEPDENLPARLAFER